MNNTPEDGKDVKILLFYKFEEIKDPEVFAEEHRSFCEKLGILGKVLVAKEGINGSVSGTEQQMQAYKEHMHTLPGFEDLWFKEEWGAEHPFTRMIIRTKKEIVALGQGDINTKEGGDYLTPEAFQEMCEKEGDDILLIDTRNDYEYKVGRFKGAINPETRTFREFPEFVDKIKDQKDKKVVMYCTGGIRCEKASAYMKQEGFDNVYQLHGGVINYIQKLPHTLWEGKCFVFDKRLVSDVGQVDGEIISECTSCGEKSDLFKNCKNPTCDKLDILCNNCQVKYHGCCSETCMKEFMKFAVARAQAKKMKKANEIFEDEGSCCLA